MSAAGEPTPLIPGILQVPYPSQGKLRVNFLFHTCAETYVGNLPCLCVTRCE